MFGSADIFPEKPEAMNTWLTIASDYIRQMALSKMSTAKDIT
jgi:hypothetical protein